MNKKRPEKTYHNESALHTIKILEALEGLNFEPVKIKTIIDRIDLPPGINKPGYDKVRAVLLTLKSCGWAECDDNNLWTLGGRILRLSNRYGELCVAAFNK